MRVLEELFKGDIMASYKVWVFGFGALLVVEEGVYVLILRFWGLGRLGFGFEFGVFGFS